jgi:Lhr-like helicase
MGVQCVVIVGGMDMQAQGLMLEKKPHIIIATPGRLVDHLENSKGFNLRQLKFLVIIHGIYKFILIITEVDSNFLFYLQGYG